MERCTERCQRVQGKGGGGGGKPGRPKSLSGSVALPIRPDPSNKSRRSISQVVREGKIKETETTNICKSKGTSERKDYFVCLFVCLVSVFCSSAQSNRILFSMFVLLKLIFKQTESDVSINPFLLQPDAC